MEQHGEYHQEIDYIPAVKVSSGEAIGHQRRDEHTEQGTNQRNADGHAHSSKYRIGRENKLVRFKAPHLRNQYKFACCDLRACRERACYHMHKGQHRHQRNESQQRKVNRGKNPAADRSVFYHFQFLPQSLNKRLLRPFFWTIC
ncbi:hypothetical protein D3C73_1104470 [compost metagenome]